jgi:hypothetical protein
MSFTTWTPLELGSSAHGVQLRLWRAVEAQHVIATRALVDSQQEQELLEALLERYKPPLPPRCGGLDYLLYTPFRYAPPPGGSRFRGEADAGVWYGAEAIRTACAEVGYWRWRFLTDSAGLQRLDAVPHTIFQALAQGSAVDLRVEPFRGDQPLWGDAVNYSACQDFARRARDACVQLIRYRSVRDPRHGGAGAVLDPAAFSGVGAVRRRQSWFLTVDRQRVSWVRVGAPPAHGHSHEFTFDALARAPRTQAQVPPNDPGSA